MSISEDDLRFMRQAIEAARACRGEDDRDHPRVGVVVVKDGQVLASAHRGELNPGEHAEYTALEGKLVDGSVAGSTVYTTLEPCTARNHPKIACAHRLVERRVARVVIGMLDPNPGICGRGVWLLREARVSTDFFPDALMSEVEELNRDFIRSHRPPPRLETPPVRNAESKAPEIPEAPAQGDAAMARAEPETKDKRATGFLVAMLDAMFAKKFDEAKLKYDEYAALVDDRSHAKRARVIYLDYRYRGTADERAIDELKELSTDADTGDIAAGTLGQIAMLANDYKAAIEWFNAAIATAKSDERAVDWLIELASTYDKIGEHGTARAALVKAFSKDVSNSTRARVLIELSDVGGKQHPLKKAALLARVAQLLPADTSKRFSAAYALSKEDGLRELAFTHYNALLSLDDDYANALNNLGVLCSELGMKGKAIELYRRAWENGETLAAANIAFLSIDAGLMSDASQLLSEASKRETVHQNVASARSSLEERQTEEDSRWSEVLTTAVKQQLFIAGFVDALLCETSDAWKTISWSTHDKRVAQIQDIDGQLICEWADESKQNRRRMKLELTGNAATLKLEKWIQTSYQGNGSGYFGDSVTGAAYVTTDGAEIKIMLVDGKTSSFVTWRRQPALPTEQPKQLGSGDSTPP